MNILKLFAITAALFAIVGPADAAESMLPSGFLGDW